MIPLFQIKQKTQIVHLYHCIALVPTPREEQGDSPTEDVYLTGAHGVMLNTGSMRAGCPLRANF